MKERGGTVVLECDRHLHPLLTGVAGIDRLTASGAEPPAVDVHAPLGALPALLGVPRPEQAPPLPPLNHERSETPSSNQRNRRRKCRPSARRGSTSGAGRTADASRHCQDVLSTDSAQPVANSMLGVIALNAGKPQDAVPRFRAAAAADPTQQQYHYHLGLALLGVGDHAAAEAAVRDAIRLRPTSSSHKALGDLLRKQDKPAEAEAAYREAVRLTPENVDALVRLGNALYARGESDEAEGVFRKAIAVQPTCANAHHNLGVILGRRGQKADAEGSYREARRLASREG